MKVFGPSAIHDEGFQFFMTINLEDYIKELVKDIEFISKLIEKHKRYDIKEKKAKKIYCGRSIKRHEGVTEFTIDEYKRIYKEKKAIYDLLMGISEKSLQEAKDRYQEKRDGHLAPYYKDPDRQEVIVAAPEEIY